MKVFISHTSRDKPSVEALARALHERGIEPWFDGWEIASGDDLVAKINDGLEAASAGLIVFSRHSRESRWVDAETSYLTYARIVEGKALIPVVIGDDAYIPPLLRALARRGIEEVDAVADAILSRTGAHPRARPPEQGRRERVTVSLRRAAGTGVHVSVRVGEQEHATAAWETMPRRLVVARDAFLRGFIVGPRRDHAGAERAALEASVAELGRALRDLCLPGESGTALAELVDAFGVGGEIEACFETNDAELLGLPFEALRLPDDRLLSTQPPVTMLRRPLGLTARSREPLAGPIKILVAVGAPDEGPTTIVLDQERELQNILDAVEVAQRRENVEVRILEVGHPDVIGAAIERDAYHALHLSCHGGPGQLELEDEDGRAVPTTASQLIDPIACAGRPLPLVFLSARHGGVRVGQTASFAQALLEAGVPCVLAMQISVSDHYATQLARSFYEHLARREPPQASRALADARKELERARLDGIRRGASLGETQPEYATAALNVAGEEPPLADLSLNKEPLRERPVHDLGGPVPQLRVDDLIGRRKELREALRTLRDPARRYAGVVLTGIGGVGKSAVAGRVMRRLAEDRWLVAAHKGRFDIQSIAVALGVALAESTREDSKQRGRLLLDTGLDDRARLQLVAKALAEESIVLVLDDFEQNIVEGGGAYRDPVVGDYLALLATNARRGRLLVTSRYPVPGADEYFYRIAIGPLSLAESRKLLQRLPALRGRAPTDLAQVLRIIGGHPRMLEFLDGLLHDGEGRLPHVTSKLTETLAKAGLNATHPSRVSRKASHRRFSSVRVTCFSKSCSPSPAAMASAKSCSRPRCRIFRSRRRASRAFSALPRTRHPSSKP